MKYYFLEEAVRTKETGSEYPQILKMDFEHDYFDDNGVYALGRIALPDNSLNLRYFLLDEKARITDVLSTVMLRLTGFLVNLKVKEILQKFELPTHRFYDAFVKDKSGNILEYFWLQMLIDYNLSYVDFLKSEFVIEESSTVFRLADHHEFLAKKESEKPKRLKLGKCRLTTAFQENPLDIFKIPQLAISWVVSERLANALVENRISGIKLTEISESVLS